MSAIVVDTSVWVAYFAGRPYPALDEALREGRVFLPPIVVAELLSAPLNATQKAELTAFLEDLPLCPCPFEHWARVGELRAACRTKGLKISTPDAHIAQCAIDGEARLATEDGLLKRAATAMKVPLLEA